MALKQRCDSNNMVDVVQTNFISNMPSVSVEQLQQQEMAKNVKHFGQKHTLHKYANTTKKKSQIFAQGRHAALSSKCYSFATD